MSTINDFEIQVQHAQGGSFKVHVLRSPASGETSGPFVLSPELEEMLAQPGGLSWVTAASRAFPRRNLQVLEPEETPLVQSAETVGAALYSSLFPPSVRSLFDRSCGNLNDGQSGLRIKLRFDLRDPDLARLHALPWELLYQPEVKRFLCLDRRLPVVRYLEVPTGVAPMAVPSPLRILVVMANPDDPQLSPLDVEKELQLLDAAVQGRKGIERHVLVDPDPSLLHARLAEGPWHVLHFMGHGAFDEAAATGVLYLVGPQREPHPLSGVSLAHLLRNFLPGLRLVVLNACDTALTAAPSGQHPFGGVAAALVEGGLPAVLAMQTPIGDQAAISFSSSFYRHLAAGDPVDVAAAHGRLAIYLSDQSSAEWATPVLFMRVPDGRLFAPLSASPGAAPQDQDQSREDEVFLGRYLQWLIEQYAELELPALGAATPSRVPLETVYVALRGDLSSPDERMVSQALLEEEARRLEDLVEVQDLSSDQRFRYVCRLIALIARHPLPLSIEERDRPHLYRPREERTVSLGEAFQNERRMVILGDPGSGKTTLVRWLTLQLAQAWQKGKHEERVLVSAHQVDPAAHDGAPDLDLGPARVPILVRVATFAAACKEDPGLSLSSFLGHHLGSASLARGEEIDPEALNALLLGFLRAGQAVVLVDGLDEIGDHEDRREVARKIDLFFDGWLRGSLALPVREGGNQVIVTSRIVGYQMAPLKREAAHLTIEPMGAAAIARFCNVWVRAVPPPGPPEGAGERAQQEAEGLQQALADLQERDAGDLTGNPLLLTILALVYRSGQATFPRQRVKLYETAVEILLDTWRRRARARGGRGLADEEVLAALVPLAAEIHETSAAGVVEEERLEQILAEHLDASEVRPFLALVEEDVGLLAARGRQVYGFLHLTFQEYLAAAALIQDRDNVAEEILSRLGSPRWREPILMALGRLSCGPDPAAFARLLLGLLAQEDPLDALVPRLPLLIVAALPEMVTVPPGVVEKTASRLLASYASLDRLERFSTLREQIEGAYSWLSESSHAGAVERVLCAALRDPTGEDQAPAAARLALACHLYSAEMGEALAVALSRDSEAWGWPVDRALRDLAGREPRFLAGGWSSLRRQLLRKPDLAATLTSHSSWRRLCLAVYGGLDSLLPERIAAARRDVSRLKAERETWNSKTQDPLYEETVARLDREMAEAEARIKPLEQEGNVLSVERIYRDSPLTPLVLAALPQGAPTRDFIEELWKIWHSPGEDDARCDAILALAALGEPVTDTLRGGNPASQSLLSRLPRLVDTLRPAVVAALPSAVKALESLQETCPVDHWRDLISAVIRVSVEVADRPLQVFNLHQKAPPSARPIVLAEVWGHMLSGANDDPLYNIAVILDTWGGISPIHRCCSPRHWPHALAAWESVGTSTAAGPWNSSRRDPPALWTS